MKELDVTEVKAILNWKRDKYDKYVETMLPLMIEAVEDYCNNQFIDEDGKKDIPAGVKVAIAKWIEYNTIQSGVTSRSQGVSYNYDGNIPDNIKTLLRPHRRMKF